MGSDVLEHTKQQVKQPMVQKFIRCRIRSICEKSLHEDCCNCPERDVVAQKLHHQRALLAASELHATDAIVAMAIPD